MSDPKGWVREWYSSAKLDGPIYILGTELAQTKTVRGPLSDHSSAETRSRQAFRHRDQVRASSDTTVVRIVRSEMMRADLLKPDLLSESCCWAAASLY
jgi:hypothetical protein